MIFLEATSIQNSIMDHQCPQDQVQNLSRLDRIARLENSAHRSCHPHITSILVRFNNLSFPPMSHAEFTSKSLHLLFTLHGKIQPIPTITFSIKSHTLPKSGQVPLLMYFYSTLYFPHYCHIFYGKYPLICFYTPLESNSLIYCHVPRSIINTSPQSLFEIPRFKQLFSSI